MSGLEKAEGPAIVAYGDILFNSKIISGLLANDKDIVIAVDSSYKYHKHEIDKKLELVEYKDVDISNKRRKLKMSDLHEVKNLGRDLNIDNAESEFFGLVYFSKEGILKLKSSYSEIKEKNRDEKTFIDILNFMINKDFEINCQEFNGGWIELHNENDFKLAEQELED